MKHYSFGFTLIELLIGLALTGIILMGVSSMTVFIATSNVRSKQLDSIQQTKYDLQNEISNSIRWTKSVVILSDGTGWTATDTDGNSITYRVQNQAIIRDGTVITSPEVAITDFSITNYSATPRIGSYSFDFHIKQRSFPTVSDTAHIVVTQRLTDIKTNK